MKFCPKCGSMLRPKQHGDKKVLACTCGYVDNAASSTMTVMKKKQDEIKFDVVEKEQSAHTLVEAECPKCKHDKAFYWSQQMRAGDEPETQFYKCEKCSHTWRQY